MVVIEGDEKATVRVLGANIHGDYSDVLELRSLEIPRVDELFRLLGANDVLIEVKFTDVNPVDLQKLRGREAMVGCPVQNPPHVPGYGGSGVVVKVGSEITNCSNNNNNNNSNGIRVKEGQPVCFLADPTRLGSYGTHVVVDANCVAKIPPASGDDNVSLSLLRDCACIPVAGLTAYESLAKCGLVGGTRETKSSDSNQSSNGDGGTNISRRLLVVGASGGVGSWTMALARALNPGLEIVATASTPAQQEWCLSLGADTAMKHDEILSRLGGGREGSVDAVVCLTEPTQELFGTLSEVIKPYGIICLVVAGTSIASLNLGFCFFKCADVKTQTVFSSIRSGYRKIVPAEELALIIDLLASGRLKAPLSPDLENGKTSESFRNALDENGVLNSLSELTGRRGNFVMKIDL